MRAWFDGCAECQVVLSPFVGREMVLCLRPTGMLDLDKVVISCMNISERMYNEHIGRGHHTDGYCKTRLENQRETRKPGILQYIVVIVEVVEVVGAIEFMKKVWFEH
jgi:hypothetical protein